MKRGKKYLEAFKKVEQEKLYPFGDAVALSKDIAFAKFDESIELSIRLNVQQKHSIRGSISLPNTVDSGDKRVLVFAVGEKAKEALDAGATYVGSEDLVDKIKGGWLEFDVAIATPDMMKDVGKLGPILGRRGLMPNPKVGTVTADVTKAVAEFKKGKTEFRADKTGIVHLKIGRVSMEASAIEENGKAIFQELMRRKPNDIKGDYVKSLYISTAMGPGIKIDNQVMS